MAKNKPKETIEYVFRLQDKERQLLDETVQFLKIRSVMGQDWFVEATKSPLHMIAFIESILTLIEFFGIETGFATPVDAYDWLKNRFKDPDGSQGTWGAFWDVDLQREYERFFGGLS